MNEGKFIDVRFPKNPKPPKTYLMKVTKPIRFIKSPQTNDQ